MVQVSIDTPWKLHLLTLATCPKCTTLLKFEIRLQAIHIVVPWKAWIQKLATNFFCVLRRRYPEPDGNYIGSISGVRLIVVSSIYWIPKHKLSYSKMSRMQTWVFTTSAVLGGGILAMVGGNRVAALLLKLLEVTTLTSMYSLYMVLAIKSAC